MNTALNISAGKMTIYSLSSTRQLAVLRHHGGSIRVYVVAGLAGPAHFHGRRLSAYCPRLAAHRLRSQRPHDLRGQVGNDVTFTS